MSCSFSALIACSSIRGSHRLSDIVSRGPKKDSILASYDASMLDAVVLPPSVSQSPHRPNRSPFPYRQQPLSLAVRADSLSRTGKGRSAGTSRAEIGFQGQFVPWERACVYLLPSPLKPQVQQILLDNRISGIPENLKKPEGCRNAIFPSLIG
jgi:hypothetical protein